MHLGDEGDGATCEAGACPIKLDVELRCNDTEFGAPGLRVAPAAGATWLATASSNEPDVYRIDGADGGVARQDGVPQTFARTTIALALADDSTVHLATDTTTQPNYAGGATWASLANGAWTSSLVFDRSDKYVPVVDLEVGADGAPRVWVVTDAPNAYTLFTGAGDGGWASSNAAVPAAGSGNRFTLARDGSIVSLAFETDATGASQLHALVNGADRLMGSTTSLGVPLYAVTPAPAPTAPASGALFAVATAHTDGVRVAWLDSTGGGEVTVGGTAPPVMTCAVPSGVTTCPGPCHETAVGMESGAFALAWTSDGVAWLAYAVTAFDQQIGYSLQGDPGLGTCVGNVQSDSSTATLHLARVALDGTTAPKDVMTMPVERPGNGDVFGDLNASVRFIDARGFGSSLALGLRTGLVGSPSAIRVLRLETPGL